MKYVYFAVPMNDALVPMLYSVPDKIKKIKYGDRARVLDYDNKDYDLKAVSDLFEADTVPPIEIKGEVTGVWRLK